MVPGGFSPDSRDIFTEGFSSPGIKLVEGGEMRRDVMDTVLNMVRAPEMVALDLSSMIAANNVARERMGALIDKYGAGPVDEACATLVEQSETLFRKRLRELPDGRWEARQYFDIEGETCRVLLAMTKEGDELTFDFTGSSPQSHYGINCTYWASWGGFFAPLFPLLCYDITWNGRRSQTDQDDRAGGFGGELHSAGAGLARDCGRDPVGQQRRVYLHRQDAVGEREIREGSNGGSGTGAISPSSCSASTSAVRRPSAS